MEYNFKGFPLSWQDKRRDWAKVGVLKLALIFYRCKKIYTDEPVAKHFSLVKVKAGKNFNRSNTQCILRIKILAQRRDWPKWDGLELAQITLGCNDA